jgi:CDP-glucose 4,6-dehydratase
MSDFWTDKNVLVTGATGLVGYWLVKELVSHGALVVGFILDSDPRTEIFRDGLINKIHVVNGKLENYFDLERTINQFEIDTVFHLGAQTIVGVANRSPLQTFEANIRGTYNLLEACRVHKNLVKRIIVASSDKAYGVHNNLPYLEDMPLKGRHAYDVSKSCADLLSQMYAYSYELPIVVARCGNIYGGGDLNWSRIIPSTIKSFISNLRPKVRSDGTFIRDYIYVKDVVGAYMLIARKLHDYGLTGETFNFSYELRFTVLKIIQTISELMNIKDNLKPIVLNTAENEIKSQFLCSQKSINTLDWKPSYSFTTGLRETIDWYLDFFQQKNSSGMI